MNLDFFRGVESALATERLGVYRQDNASHAIALARYLWNMALCETLYSPLQIVEIALRNAIHSALSNREGSDEWYNTINGLTEWQQQQLKEGLSKLQKKNKPATPGRLVAELHFGFWTGFFNNEHARTGIGYALSHNVFKRAPKREQSMKSLDIRLSGIRDLRNRVFHHERIIHWTDLDDQHFAILELLGWISPDLQELASVLDRYTPVRRAGHSPWLHKLRCCWPDPATRESVPTRSTIAHVTETMDASNGVETPFGHRLGGDKFALDDNHIDKLLEGQALALDVQNKYIAYLLHAAAHTTTPTAQTSPSPEAQHDNF